MASGVRDDVAANVRARRAYLGLGQEEVGERMRLAGFKWSAPTVSRVEKCLRSITVDELVALADALHTDLMSLLQQDGRDW